MSDTPAKNHPGAIIRQQQQEIAALRAELEEAKHQKRLGWERAAEKDAAYGGMIAERDALRAELEQLSKRIDNEPGESLGAALDRHYQLFHQINESDDRNAAELEASNRKRAGLIARCTELRAVAGRMSDTIEKVLFTSGLESWSEKDDGPFTFISNLCREALAEFSQKCRSSAIETKKGG